MMSNCSVEVLHGFGALAGCHIMEFDYVASSNYSKISKNMASILWKLHKSSNVDNGKTDTNYLTLMEGHIGGKLLYYEHMPERNNRL